MMSRWNSFKNQYKPRLSEHLRAWGPKYLIFSVLILAIGGFQNCSDHVSFKSSATAMSSLNANGPTGSLSLNAGAPYTNNQTVSAAMVTTNATGYMLANDTCPAIKPDASQFLPLQPTTNWVLSDQDGQASVYLLLLGANNVISDCLKAQITLDRKAPDISFSNTPQKITNSSLAYFGISAADSGSGLKQIYCHLSGQTDFTPCTPTTNLVGIAEGTVSFSAYAVDNAGNTSATVNYSWLVDLTAPTVAIAMPTPAPVITMSSATVYFKGDDGLGSGVASYKCSLNGQDIPICNSPMTLTGLPDGPYTFSVVAIDHVGWASTSAIAQFTIDTKLSSDFQVIGVTGGGDTKIDNYLTNLTTPILNWSASTGVQSYMATILDLTGATTVCGPTSFAGTLTSGPMDATCKLLDNTKYLVRMSAFRNGLEKKAADFILTVDATGPVIQITSQTIADDLQTATFNFTVTDIGSGVQSATCYRIYNTDIRQDSCTGLTTINYTALAVGNYSFYITAIDNAGNTSQSTLINFTVHSIVCDPFHLVEGPCQKGLRANLYYASAADRALGNSYLGSTLYNSVGKLISGGLKSIAIIYLPFLDVRLRAFTDGFATTTNSFLADDSGQKLDEWFALEMTSFLKLSPTDSEGYYQIIVASDDGSNFLVDPNATGAYQTLINNDGVHSDRVGCAAKGAEVHMTAITRLPIKIQYYQGPRNQIAMSIFWRLVPSAGSALSSHCNYASSSSTDWFGDRLCRW